MWIFLVSSVGNSNLPLISLPIFGCVCIVIYSWELFASFYLANLDHFPAGGQAGINIQKLYDFGGNAT